MSPCSLNRGKRCSKNQTRWRYKKNLPYFLQCTQTLLVSPFIIGDDKQDLFRLSFLPLQYFTLTSHIFESVCSAMFLDTEGKLNDAQDTLNQ